MSREVVLAARPVGEPAESDFELRESPDAVPGDGEVAIRNVFVSVDPYMRGRMTGIRTYVPPFEVGQVVDGAAVGRVTISRDERFAESFAKWASGDIGVDLYLGYKVPPPDDLANWGAPLAALAAGR